MDNEIGKSRASDAALSWLETMKGWIVDPLREEMHNLRTSVDAAIQQINEQQTNYVRRDELDARRAEIERRFGEIEKREEDRRNSFRWMVGSAIGAATIVATIISAITPYLHAAAR